MARKYRLIKVTKECNLMDEKNSPIICPVRAGTCNSRCAWYSIDGRIARCQDTPIGALGAKPIRSFRLSLGPLTYDYDKP